MPCRGFFLAHFPCVAVCAVVATVELANTKSLDDPLDYFESALFGFGGPSTAGNDFR